MDDQVSARVRTLVRLGFYERDELLEDLVMEADEEGYEVGEDELAEAIDAELAALRAEQKRWPGKTDNDRLDDAFVALEERGIIALHNAGFTIADGVHDAGVAFGEHSDPDSVEGFCFYHEQDSVRALEGGGLYLGFGSFDDGGAGSEEVAAAIVEELRAAGLTAVWSGDTGLRIEVTPFVWKRRI